jgi:hypothetical protein
MIVPFKRQRNIWHVRFGSLADMCSPSEARPLYPRKRTWIRSLVRVPIAYRHLRNAPDLQDRVVEAEICKFVVIVAGTKIQSA